MAAVRIQDIVNPETFSGYVRQATEEKWNLLRAGVVAADPFLDNLLTGAASQNSGGVTFQIPSWKPLDGDDEENTSTDTQADILRLVAAAANINAGNILTDESGQTNALGAILAAAGANANTRGDAVPRKIESSLETAVRLSRNNSWSAMDLSSKLAASDPLAAIVGMISEYWFIRLQKLSIATMQGVFNDNAAAPSGSEHVQNDLSLDVSGGSFDPGVTNITAEAVIDALSLLGDSRRDIVAMMVHSTVYSTLEKNDLIDFARDSESNAEIPTFRGLRLIEDDGLPNPAGNANYGANTAAGIFHTWFLGRDALRYGSGSPMVPTETHREPLAGQGGGQEILIDRVEWMVHPTGHAFTVATPPPGGPRNSNSTGNLAHVDSWQRVFPERKQIKVCRLVTRES